MTADHYFLGGHDLEMMAIARLLRDERAVFSDAGLAWGARATAYGEAIGAAVDAGDMPVLVELADDLPPGIDRERLAVIDHHGSLAGSDRPSSLRQVFDRLGLDAARWTRECALVAANDVGHIAGMVAIGASPEEIMRIRAMDRAAQGVTRLDEAEARRGIERRRRIGRLTVVKTASERTSPVTDLLDETHGGDGAAELLVFTPSGSHFFGSGAVVAALSGDAGCWYGGALPQRGFWGNDRPAGEKDEKLIARIVSLLDAAGS